MTRPTHDAVFWDIGGVILDHESVREAHIAFVRELLAAYESPLSTECALETWRSELGAYFGATAGTDYRPAREGYRLAVDAIVAPEAEDIDWRTLLRRVSADQIRANPGAVETIARFDDAPVHLGVISDVDHDEGRDILETLGVDEYFDSVTTSGAVGKKKPDPAIFETALAAAGVAPSASIMIGDRYSHDMVGGHEAGMTTVAYGASDGPAVDYVVEDLTELLVIVGLDSV